MEENTLHRISPELVDSITVCLQNDAQTECPNVTLIFLNYDFNKYFRPVDPTVAIKMATNR